MSFYWHYCSAVASPSKGMAALNTACLDCFFSAAMEAPAPSEPCVLTSLQMRAPACPRVGAPGQGIAHFVRCRPEPTPLAQ